MPLPTPFSPLNPRKFPGLHEDLNKTARSAKHSWVAGIEKAAPTAREHSTFGPICATAVDKADSIFATATATTAMEQCGMGF
ncbi:hypothetical protein MSAN_01087100 [Mycena sanguinolenta]|uniref:Uncharacterized protein n=1 Tax=Mycena sanguinolenta TaxID=230812 RepID=A0A8H7D9X1_9AGAR|nr:hypothetical protein MSAN_01087100 [Mycena sanguinolenta]